MRHGQLTENTKKRIGIYVVCTVLMAFAYSACPGVSMAGTSETRQEKEDFDFANGLLSRGMHDMAASSYRDFLKKYPQSQYAEEARYRRAESYFLCKNNEKALEEFHVFLTEKPSSSMAANARLRIGQIFFAAGEMAKADSAMREVLLSPGATEKAVEAAKYYIADILIKTDRPFEAKKALEELMETYKEGAYTGFAGLSLGDILLEEKDFQQAASIYAVAAKTGTEPGLKAEASLRGAGALYLAGETDMSVDKYKEVQKSAPNPDFAARAALGIVSVYYNSGDSDSAIEQATELLEKTEAGETKCRIKLLLANSYLNSKLFEDAKKVYGQVERECSFPLIRQRAMLNNCWALYNLGEHEECFNSAEIYLKEIEADNIDEARYLKGKALGSLGKWKMAAEEYEIVLKDHAGSFFRKETLYDKGWAHYQQGDVVSGTKVHRQFLDEFPRDDRSPGILLKIGQEALKGGKYEEAIDLYGEFLDSYPKDPQRQFAMYQKARAFYEAGRYLEAIALYEAILEDFPYSEITGNVFYWRALCYQKREDWANAVKDFREAANKGGELTVKASEAVAYSLFRQGKETDAAEAYYAVISESIGAHAGIKKDIYLWTAEFYTTRKESDKALDVLNSMEKSYPGSADANVMYLFGENYSAKGQDEAALKSFAVALEGGISSPGKERCYLGVGRILAKKGENEKALKTLEKALAGDRDNLTGALARGEIGNIYAGTNNYEEAAKQYSMVAILYDDEEITPNALFLAAVYFTKAGKKGEADKLFGELQARYPRSSQAEKAKESTAGINGPEKI